MKWVNTVVVVVLNYFLTLTLVKQFDTNWRESYVNRYVKQSVPLFLGFRGRNTVWNSTVCTCKCRALARGRAVILRIGIKRQCGCWLVDSLNHNVLSEIGNINLNRRSQQRLYSNILLYMGFTTLATIIYRLLCASIFIYVS